MSGSRIHWRRAAGFTALWLLGACSELLPPIIETGTGSSGTTNSSTGPATLGDSSASTAGQSSTASTTQSTASATGSSSGDLVDSTGSTGPDSNEGWEWRRVIGLSAAGTHSNVPVRIRLPPSFDVQALYDPPNDLRFVTPAGQTLPHEIERWEFPTRFDAGAEIWVLVPEIGADTDIWMEYGHQDPPPAEPGSVWPDALGVWHLAGQQPVDSSAAAQPVGMSEGTNVVGGAIGMGHAYSGTSWDELHTGEGALGSSTEGTVQLWFRGSMAQTSEISTLLHGTPDPESDLYGGNQELYVAILQPGAGSRRVTIHGYSPGGVAEAEANGDWLDNTWHHVVATWENGNELTVTVDGRRGDSEAVSMNIDNYMFSEWVRLGYVSDHAQGPTRSFAGAIDEVRLYDFAFTPERTLIESLAQQADFASLGDAVPLR